MSDARHEFVAASVATLRSVPVVSERGADDAGTRRMGRQRVYRALSGVSFQSSVGASGYGPAADDWQSEREAPAYWVAEQRAATPAPVRVTFVKRTITDYSATGKRSVTDDEDFDDDADADADETPGVAEAHIYDTPCALDELHSELVLSDSDLSGLDLSIFEQSTHSTPPPPPRDEGAGDRQPAFIYRPPRPKRTLSRGKMLRDRFKKPLKRLFNAPAPPAVDYDVAAAIPVTIPVTDLDAPEAREANGQLRRLD